MVRKQISDTHIGFNQVISVWNEVVVVFHVAPLLDAHEVLHRVEILADAGAGQELLVRHRIAQVNRDVVVVGQRNVVALLGLVTRTHLVFREERERKMGST